MMMVCLALTVLGPEKYRKQILVLLVLIIEALAVFDVIFVFITGIIIFKLSRTLHLSEISRFKEETGK
jgi:hypothetical protein